MPRATDSPWEYSYCETVSMAWPKVWPKFRCARSPFSNGSAATTFALIATLWATSSAR